MSSRILAVLISGTDGLLVKAGSVTEITGGAVCPRTSSMMINRLLPLVMIRKLLRTFIAATGADR